MAKNGFSNRQQAICRNICLLSICYALSVPFLPDSSDPGGHISYIQDPGSAQVFIEEKQNPATVPCQDVLAPWVSQVEIPDKEHKEVTIFVNGKTHPIARTQVQDDSSILLLISYSLGRIRTVQDDPLLWLAAVKKHLPKLDNPKLRLPRLLFGVGRITSKEENPLNSMEMVEDWLLIRAYNDMIKPIRIGHLDSVDLFPEHILQISRPSAGQDTAIVHAGSNPAPLSGRGKARIWKILGDESWIETEEVITSWIS